MDASWLDRYIDAWLLHPVAGTVEGESELKSLLKFFSPEAIYEDVPSSSLFQGHEGIKEMCELANQWSSDLDFNVRGTRLLVHPLCECELLSVEPGLDELDWGEPAVRAVRPVDVVVDPPVLEENLGLEQGVEALAVQELVA